jgi:prefoldin subunit 5
MDNKSEHMLTQLLEQNKLILEKLNSIETRLDHMEKSTTNMDTHIEEINQIYSNYKSCLDFINNKYESCCNSLKYFSSPQITNS